MEENQKAASAWHGESGYSGPQETDADVAAEELLIQSPWQRKPGRQKTEAPFPVPPIIFWNYYAFAAAFFFRKKPPAMHTSRNIYISPDLFIIFYYPKVTTTLCSPEV